MKSDDVDPGADWDPAAPNLRADQRAAHDELRGRCPVARDGSGNWLLLRHADVRRAALDDATFSSAASRFTGVPNSMDGDQHRRFRELIDRFLDPARIEPLVPMLRDVAQEAIGELPRGVTVDAVDDLGLTVAIRAQSRWLGWPKGIESTLRSWVRDNEAATRSGELARTREVSDRFDAIVREQIDRSLRSAASPGASQSVTAELVRAMVEDPAAPGGRRALTELEAVSILRNWTAGDLGSVARAFGVVVHYLATHPAVQSELRRLAQEGETLDHQIDEMLRIDDPFVSNRRVTTHDVDIGGRTIPRGARVILSWTAANRDPARFAQPDAYQPRENAEHNVVYGIGPHACPGRALATSELRESLRALLSATKSLSPDSNEPAVRATAPLGGYARVPVILR